jgi:hypothetical protein
VQPFLWFQAHWLLGVLSFLMSSKNVMILCFISLLYILNRNMKSLLWWFF